MSAFVDFILIAIIHVAGVFTCYSFGQWAMIRRIIRMYDELNRRSRTRS